MQNLEVKDGQMKKRTKKWGSLLLVALVVLASLFLGDESLLNGLTGLGMSQKSVRKLQALVGLGQGKYEPAKNSDYYRDLFFPRRT